MAHFLGYVAASFCGTYLALVIYNALQPEEWKVVSVRLKGKSNV